MTTAIYKIVFSDGSFYIGQTIDYEKRIRGHQVNKGKGSPKLEAAYAIDPNPIYEIITTCAADELDILEQQYIEEMQPTLNTLPGGEGMRGLNHPRSKYTKQQIEEVVSLFINTTTRYSDIAVLTEVHTSTVHDVCKGRSHHWALEGIPKEKILDALYARSGSTKILYDPYNNKYIGYAITDLAEKTGLTVSSIRSILNSAKGVSHSGWGTTPHQVYELIDPLDEKHVLTYPKAKELLESYQLSRYQISKLLKDLKPSAGWKITLFTQKCIDKF